VYFLKKNRTPLLLIAGTRDHLVPQKVAQVEKHHDNGPAIVKLKILRVRPMGL
jgi:hypothetical protein